MSATILLISTDSAADLRHSLPAAIAQDAAEVVVLDNASADATGEIARRHGARHLRLDRRHSWSSANNAGLRATDGDPVLLLNADCVLAPDFLARARARLVEPGIGSVAPKLVRSLAGDPPRRLHEIDAAGIVMSRTRRNNLHGHGAPESNFSTAGEAFGADGAAALYARDALSDCELDGEILDESFEGYGADVDLAWRAQLLGWRCAYEPSALAWHTRVYSPSTRAQMPAAYRRQQFRNRYLMMLKNDTLAGVARDLPRLAGFEALALGHAVLRERELLGAYAEAVRLAPRAVRARRELRHRRRARAPFGLVAR